MEKGGENFHIRNNQFGIENKGCVTPCGLAIYIKKVSEGKRRIMKIQFKYFTMQKYNLQKKNPLKETKILQDIITL
jgi:hypothetical protein